MPPQQEMKPHDSRHSWDSLRSELVREKPVNFGVWNGVRRQACECKRLIINVTDCLGGSQMHYRSVATERFGEAFQRVKPFVISLTWDHLEWLKVAPNGVFGGFLVPRQDRGQLLSPTEDQGLNVSKNHL